MIDIHWTLNKNRLIETVSIYAHTLNDILNGNRLLLDRKGIKMPYNLFIENWQLCTFIGSNHKS